jgi:succinoglycan biosynthesis transport protein ExoP
MAQQVAAFEGSLNQAKQAVASDEKRSSELKAEMQKTPSRSSTQEVSSQEAILLQQLQANLLAAQVNRTDLLMKYDPSYPLVREADQEIAETQAAISEAEKNQILSSTTDRDPTYELLRENLAQTQADLAAQLADVRATEGSIQNMQAKMVDLDQKAVTQSDLIRETKADESNYLLYLSKREQERTSDALDQKRIANVAIAVPPMLPVLPVFSPLLVLAIGFFLALFVGIGAAFLMDYLDVSFRTPTEVASVLEIPVLASIPRRVA